MGSCNSLMFHSESRRVAEFQDILHKSAVKYNYPGKDIGGYLLPIERGRAIYCEFDLHYDSNNTENTEDVKRLNTEASKALIEAGAFFDRPYSVWADLMYSRTGTYTEYLKKLKVELDPNNIMNPGKLCF
jgi:FAD/FMN-containing dehydrogenase